MGPRGGRGDPAAHALGARVAGDPAVAEADPGGARRGTARAVVAQRWSVGRVLWGGVLTCWSVVVLGVCARGRLHSWSTCKSMGAMQP